MPLSIGCTKAVVQRNIRTLIHEGYHPKVASAIAYKMAREHRKMCKHRAHLRKPKRGKKKRGNVSFQTADGTRVSFRARK